MNKVFTLLKYTLYLCTGGLAAYCLYYLAMYSYLIYAIDKHDDQVLTQMIKENDEYMKLSYLERYTPPKNKHKNIPDPAFWIPNTKIAGYFVHVTAPDKSLIRLEMYSDVVVDANRPRINNAVLILKSGIQEDNVPFTRFTHPNLPEDEVTYKLGSQHFVPDEIKEAFPTYEEYWYLEYPQGYLLKIEQE